MLMESSDKLKRKGRIVVGEDESIVLVNEENKGYRVDEVIASIWYECDGKTIDELIDIFTEGVEEKEEKEVIGNNIRLIVSKLQEVKLVE